MDAPNRSQDFAWRRVFEQVSGSSGLKRLTDITLAGKNGQNNRSGVGTRMLDPSDYANPIHYGHAQIQQHYVGLVPFEQFDGLRAIPGVTHDDHIFRLRQNGHDPIGYNRMIFRHENPDGRLVHFFHRFESRYCYRLEQSLLGESRVPSGHAVRDESSFAKLSSERRRDGLWIGGRPSKRGMVSVWLGLRQRQSALRPRRADREARRAGRFELPDQGVLFVGDFIMPYLRAPFVEEGNLQGRGFANRRLNCSANGT